MAVSINTITGTGYYPSESGVRLGNKFSILLSGIGTASISLQVSDNGTDWSPVETFTADSAKAGDMHESLLYRLNCTAWTSGTIRGRLAG